MSISSIFSHISSQSIGSKLDLSSLVSSTSTNGTSSTSSGATSTEISDPAKQMQQLQDLASSDPEKFKKVTAEIASKLTDAAKNESGQSASFMNDLAAKFQKASDTGDASALTPQQNDQNGAMSIQWVEKCTEARGHPDHLPDHHQALQTPQAVPIVPTVPIVQALAQPRRPIVIPIHSSNC